MNFPEYKTFFNFISKFLCLFGLIYQTSGILKAFLQGKTVVNIEIDRKVNNTLPAITICYPYSISFEKISKLNDVYQEQYGTYLGYSLNYSLTKSEVWQSKMIFIYREVVNDIFEQINNFSLDINQVFTNFSIDFENDQGERMIVIGSNMENFTDMIGHPIESVKIDKTPFGEWKTEKCFTFFSALDKRYRDSNFHLGSIYTTLVF